jgi:hypothetical protein
MSAKQESCSNIIRPNSKQKVVPQSGVFLGSRCVGCGLVYCFAVES